MGEDGKQMNITSQHGFTLIELIVVIVLLAVVSAIALPSFQSTIVNNMMATYTNEFVADLHFAKTEAIKRSKTIAMCSSNETATNCSDSSDWGTYGWLVVDKAEDGTLTEIIRVHEPIDASYGIGEYGTNNTGQVVFNRYGYTSSGEKSFRVCDPYGVTARTRGVVMQTSGRIRLASDSDGDGIVEKITGTSIGAMLCDENLS